MAQKLIKELTDLQLSLIGLCRCLPTEAASKKNLKDVEMIFKNFETLSQDGNPDQSKLQLMLTMANSKYHYFQVMHPQIFQTFNSSQFFAPPSESKIKRTVHSYGEYHKQEEEEDKTTHTNPMMKKIEEGLETVQQDIDGLKEDKKYLVDSVLGIYNDTMDEVTKDLRKTFYVRDFKNLKIDEPLKYTKEESEELEKEIRKDIDGEINLGFNNIDIKLYDKNKKKEDQLDKDDSKFEDPNKSFVMRDGNLVEGKAEQRKYAEYSNWHGGNPDPVDVQRHRELLHRQHFEGPKWEDGKPNFVWEKDQFELYDPEKLQKKQKLIKKMKERLGEFNSQDEPEPPSEPPPTQDYEIPQNPQLAEKDMKLDQFEKVVR